MGGGNPPPVKLINFLKKKVVEGKNLETLQNGLKLDEEKICFYPHIHTMLAKSWGQVYFHKRGNNFEFVPQNYWYHTKRVSGRLDHKTEKFTVA